MRLILADDATLLREGLAGLLERQGHQVVAQASTATELQLLVSQSMSAGDPIDLVCTDVKMPPGMNADGLDAALEIRREYPGLGIMVLSQYVAPAYAKELFAGASELQAPDRIQPGGVGYLLKERVARIADFMDSLHVVATGGIIIDPEVAARLVAGDHSRLRALTDRELEVLKLMAQGLSNTQIAATLVLSAGAVSKHVANVFAKLGLLPGEENRRVRAVLAYLTAGHTDIS